MFYQIKEFLRRKINLDIYDAVNYVFDGDALLFIGAGFSRGTMNSKGTLVPTTNGLSERLQLELGITTSELDTTTNIQQVSEYFIDIHGKSKLVKILKEEFEVSHTSRYQNTITKQDWRRIYTTNYDNILEVSSIVNGIHRYPVNVNERRSKPKTEDRKQIVHINGFVDDITTDTIMTDIKLTNSSYLENNFLEGQWRTEFDIDLNHSKVIFFIGFSLNYDLDLKRIIAQNKKWKEKIFFINGEISNKFEKNNLEKFGNVLSLTAEDFSNILENEYKKYVPKTYNKETLYSFSHLKPSITNENILDKDMSSLFYSGYLDEKKIYTYGDEEGKYIVKRNNAEEVFNILEEKELLVFHSEFGNGKTVFLKNIEALGIKKGYEVYSYKGNPHDIANDIDILNGLDIRKGIITIDDYYGIKSEFQCFSKLDKEKFVVILTGRSSIHYNMYSELIRRGKFNDSKTTIMSINYLEDYEIDQIYDLMEYHNMWGSAASYSKNRKKTLLKGKNHKQFKNIMFNIFKSQDMFNRLYKLYLSLNIELKELTIVSLINNILRSGLSFNQMLILSDKISLSAQLTNEANFKEFIDYANGMITLNSSIASQEILKKETDKKLIISVMEKLIKKADRIDAKKTYNYLKRELVSYSNFKMIFGHLSKDKLNDLAVEYFESIRNTKFANNNPFFWLQYGIQKLEQKDYKMAELFFMNANSYAQSQGYFDFYQLHAQRARLLIEKSIQENITSDQAFINFEEAHSLLIKDLTHPKNNRVYQLRQALQYKNFYNKFYHSLSSAEQMLILKHFRDMLEYIDNYINEMVVKNEVVDDRINTASSSLKVILSK